MNQTISPNAQVEDSKNVYRCGSLTYTKIGIIMLFTWLLWGDFCYFMLEKVVPAILPLKLKDLGCPNWLMGAILSTIPGIFNMTICPWVSFKSDRFRSRWGRRIPFMAATLPFMSISLVLLGCSDMISAFLSKNVSFLQDWTPATITIALICIFMSMYQFFDMFVSSVFYYLFNDVVPAQFLGRFMSSFRVVGTVANTLFSFFLFQYAEEYMQEIFIGTAILYFVGFGVMCFMVKEGKYPPIEGEKDKDNKGWGSFKTFAKESFTHKFYWTLFAFTGLSAVANATGIFGIFFKRDMGLSLANIGHLSAIHGIVVIIAVLVAGAFIDRWHPIRIMVYSAVFSAPGALLNWKWVYITLPPDYYFWLSLFGEFITVFHATLLGLAALPLMMRLLPPSRYGQFCSAQALVRSICTMSAGVLAGLFIDVVKWLCNGSDIAYRYCFIWVFTFTLFAAFFKVSLYLQWYKLGGDSHFHPPAPWSHNKMEKIAIVPTIGPSTRWTRISLYLFDGTMAISLLSIPFLMIHMYYVGAMTAFRYFGIIMIPLSLIAWWIWHIVRINIAADMKRIKNGQQPLNGLPHHGMLMVVSSKYILLVLFCIVQIVVSIHLKMETAALIFEIANIFTNITIAACVYLFTKIEKGRLVTLDKNLA